MIAIILGTRPEIIKVSPIIRECIKKKIDFYILHTNQHYTQNMDHQFFEELELPPPKYNIGVSFETYHGRMTGKMLMSIEEILISDRPEWVLVEGDTNTVLAGALVASKMGIKVGHIEAGLRSFDMTMPEEVNRIMTDHISYALFCPTITQQKILKQEGIDKRKIYLTGNTIVDAVYQNLKIIEKKDRYQEYKNKKYFLLTLHRPSNVDSKEKLLSIFSTLEEVGKEYGIPILFPIHPRTKKQLENFEIKLNKKIFTLIEPVGYLEMLTIEKYAKLILTDSGGVQEEACILNVPCVTLRENTERPETLDIGANILAGQSKESILFAVKHMLKLKKKWANPFGNGTAGKKIVNILQSS